MPKLNLQPALETTKDAEGSQVNLLHPKQKPCLQNPKTYLKLFFVVAIITFIVVAIVYRDITGKIFQDFLTWFMENLFLGALAFMCIYWIATVAFIPGTILTLGAGFVFSSSVGIVGIFIATLVVWLGAALGATTAFILSKCIFRDSVESFKSKSEKFDLIDKVVALNGFKVTLLLRLSPIVPFNAFNYFMGLTGVKFTSYCLAHFGMIPGTMAYCFIGGTLGSIADTANGSVGFGNPVVLVLTIVGTIVTIIGMVGIGIYGKKQFEKLAEEVKKNKENEDEHREQDKLETSPEATKYTEKTDTGDIGDIGDNMGNDTGDDKEKNDPTGNDVENPKNTYI